MIFKNAMTTKFYLRNLTEKNAVFFIIAIQSDESNTSIQGWTNFLSITSEETNSSYSYQVWIRQHTNITFNNDLKFQIFKDKMILSMLMMKF